MILNRNIYNIEKKKKSKMMLKNLIKINLGKLLFKILNKKQKLQ